MHEVEIVVRADELRRALRKIPDTEIMLKIDDRLTLEGYNTYDRVVVDADIHFTGSQRFTGYMKPIIRVFPDHELVSWLKAGDVLRITFQRGRDGTWRYWEVKPCEEVKV